MGDRMNQTINPNSTAQGEASAELESHQNAAQQELRPPGHTPVPHTLEKNEARNSKSLNVMQTTSIHRVVTALIATWVALCLSGCASFELAEVEMPWSEGEEELAEVPERIVSFWSDTVLHQKGLPGVRGFGGRVFFYGSEGEDPIKVDGGARRVRIRCRAQRSGASKAAKEICFHGRPVGETSEPYQDWRFVQCLVALG